MFLSLPFFYNFITLGWISFRGIHTQNQLLALDKENNTIHTTIHTNLLVESFYTTPNGSNNNLFSEMNEYNSKSCSKNNANNIQHQQQNMASPTRENLLIDNSQCTGCNRDSCNQLCSMNTDVAGNNNDMCGKEWKVNKFLMPFYYSICYSLTFFLLFWCIRKYTWIHARFTRDEYVHEGTLHHIRINCRVEGFMAEYLIVIILIHTEYLLVLVYYRLIFQMEINKNGTEYVVHCR